MPACSLEPIEREKEKEGERKRESLSKRNTDPEKERDTSDRERGNEEKEEEEEVNGKKRWKERDGQTGIFCESIDQGKRRDDGDEVIPLFRIFPFSLACVIYKDRKAPSVIRQ